MYRILFVTDEYPPDTGGIGEYVYQIATGLKQSGWEVAVAALRLFTEAAVVAAFDEQENYPIYQLQSQTDYQGIWRAIKAFQPALVITGNLPLVWTNFLVCKLLHVPFLAIAHGSEFRQSSRPKNFLKRFVFGQAISIIANSKFTIQKMQALGIQPKHLHLVYPGGNAALSPHQDSSFLRDRYQLKGKQVLLTLGTLSPRKGQHMVLQALPEILSVYPNVHYVLVGRDRTEGAFARLAQELGVTHALTFAGVIPESEKAAFYHLADIHLMTSQNLDSDMEGYGISIIEAALCQRTSIGTYQCGTEEAIQHEKTGLLVPQASPSAVASAVKHLLMNPSLRETLAQQAYSWARAEATWEERTREFERVLRAIPL